MNGVGCRPTPHVIFRKKKKKIVDIAAKKRYNADNSTE
jgi:hypothetical protein